MPLAKKGVRCSMKQDIGCDTHLRYSVFRILSEDGNILGQRCE
jgi:hypothetical protein